MKFIRLATVAALSTTIFAGGVQAFADDEVTETKEVRNAQTEGSVSFTATDEDGEGDNTEVENPDPDEIGPDVEIPPVTNPDGTNKGPLTIAYVPTMNFGSQVISNQDRDYSMIAEMQQLRGTEGDENKVPYVSFAQVQDTRGTNEGWDLTVSLSDFTADTLNDTLTGAKITLIDPNIDYISQNQANAPAAHANNLEIHPNAGAVSVMTAANTKGAGTSSVVWGDHATIAAQAADVNVETVRNDAIQLSVPGSTVKDAATYTSTLTWELSLTPENIN
ncbi:WxL domain-containing protein [Enterococcus casseliflavus]|uniref:WxL domain-containing protein n=1 Tax=Enterococcus sp. 8E11_MSG4843 TaxID=1834190 RepID=UPI000B3E74EF|nr:WxL domain-containing protein [Enterococcus sp. 8E11_MSG4843]MBO1097896.1 WxL domain-containing protein [Enterococcus casseliflavus]MBO1145444.1 WxL domain-containing protein [Enterococcus casseliflavus]OUZ30164.1 hypothetical protein A5885_003345 [Enterococcus sp. 8E11_MSG4843]